MSATKKAARLSDERPAIRVSLHTQEPKKIREVK